MKVPVAIPRRARWAVPAGGVTVVAVAAAASAITVAQAAPALPTRTPAQLLAAVAGQTAPPPPLTGTVVETASLGIPQLPGAAAPTSITSLLSGSHTIKVWYRDPAHLRLAVPVQMGETDLIRNGRTTWLWQSSGNSVTKLLLPARPPRSLQLAPAKIPLTPQQAAKQALKAAGPATRVSTESNVMVAGQPAYQLVLAPKSGQSLIGKVTIAVDGKHPGVPLRVQVFARGAKAPAFSVGYTSVSFVRPAPANFSFTPPKGAHVKTVPASGWYAYAPMTGQSGPAGWTGYAPGSAGAPQILGKDWLTVAALPASALTGLGSGNAASAAGQAAQSLAGHGGGVNGVAVLGALLRGARPVHGTWGHGRLLRTSMVSMLVTSNGHVLVGAVTPSVLYADAAQVK